MAEEIHITAIILAGGKSSRMGTDKGLLDIHGIKMVECVLQNVRSLTNQILIISNNPEYNAYGYPVCSDIHKNCGPLGGIHAGLSYSKTEWNIVVGCDLPYVTPEVLSFLISNISNADAIVPVHDSFTEPLCALYNKISLPKIESLLLRQELKMQNVLKLLDSKFIDVPKEKFDVNAIFKNINSMKDVPVAISLS
ncbi:MAG: molybdenum cofactor guanylyltransferase [Bacteroidetes bacterium]|nr:molybdenum cofactor guanylyltransferase [Bacteroidota bacterium]